MAKSPPAKNGETSAPKPAGKAAKKPGAGGGAAKSGGGALRAFFRVLRFLLLVVPWAAFTAWLFVYDMPWSGAHALLGLWVLWPHEKPPSYARGLSLLCFGAALLTVPLVGLPEYATTTQRLHCRALGFLGSAPATVPGVPVAQACPAADLADGKRVAREGGALYTLRERAGVHGFNHVLAAGGVLAGFPEVAYETVLMSWKPDPLGDATVRTQATRKKQCEASYARGKDAGLAAREVWESDLPMRSARVRQLVADGMAKLGKAPGSTLEVGRPHWSSGGTNDLGAYSGALLRDSFRVAIALEVGDSRLTLTRRADGGADAAWDGTIHYPAEDIAFAAPLPALGGARLHPDTRILRVSETIFCGMSADGAMNPFALRYVWTLAADDPRLGAEARDESDRTPLEVLAGWLAG